MKPVEIDDRTNAQVFPDGSVRVTHENGNEITLTDEGAMLLAVLVLGRASAAELERLTGGKLRE